MAPTMTTIRTAARAAGVDEPTIARIVSELDRPPDPRSALGDQLPRLEEQRLLARVTQSLVWLGIFLVIGANGWWAAESIGAGHYGRLLGVTLGYMAVFLLGAELARRRGMGSVSGGLGAAVTFATPLAAYAALRMHRSPLEHGYPGFYEFISGTWIWMEVAAFAVGLLVIWRYRRPVTLLPVSLFTVFAAMDGGRRLAGSTDFYDYDSLIKYVLAAGAVLLLVGLLLDLRGLRRFAFWPHSMALYAGLWSIGALCDYRASVFLLSGAGAMALGVWLGRRLYIVTGAFVAWTGMARLPQSEHRGMVLVLIGLALVGTAVALATIDTPLRGWLNARTLPATQRD